MAKVLFVDDIHLATTRSRPPRLLVTVQGRVTSTGWSDGRLEPWVYIAPPADGLQDLDFVATPPSGLAGQVLMPITGGTSFLLPEWCKGVRVHASANSIESKIPEQQPVRLLGATEEGGPGDNWPWQGPDSWPWLIAPEQVETMHRLATIGSVETAECKVSDLIGRQARIIRDGDPTDMMYLPDRVTVVLARDKNVIVDVRFG